MAKLIRTVLLGLTVCGFLKLTGHSVADELLLSDSVQPEVAAKCEVKLQECLKEINRIGETFAVKTELRREITRPDGGLEVEVSQQYLFRSEKLWSSHSIGTAGGRSIDRREYFDGKSIWFRDIMPRPVITDDWKECKYSETAFDPRYVWLTSGITGSLPDSLTINPSDCFKNAVCVRSKTVKNEIHCLFSRTSAGEDLNRITELRFSGGNKLPSEIRLYASLRGPFDAQKATEASSKYVISHELSWTNLGSNEDIPAPSAVNMLFSSDKVTIETEMKFSWLLSGEIPKEFFDAPTTPNSKSPSELDFK